MSAALRPDALETLTTLRDWGLKLGAISNTVQAGSPVSTGLFSFFAAHGIIVASIEPGKSFSGTALRALVET